MFRELVLARQSEDASLPQGVWKRELKRADWRRARELASRSKDLQIAAWYVEADLHLAGFGALAPDLELLAGLCRNFWQQLFPLSEPDDPGVRNAPFEWLNAKLPILLHQLPLAQSGRAGEAAFTWTDLINARRHEVVRQSDPRAAARAEEAGRVTLAAFDECVAEMPIAMLQSIADDLASAHARLQTLVAELDGLAGRDAPGLVGLAVSIEEIGDWARSILAKRVEAAIPRGNTPAEVREAPAGLKGSLTTRSGSSAYAAPGPIASRDEAYRQLTAVADYLLANDPHSPIPYILQRAVELGQLGLPELLEQVSDEEGGLSRLLEALGLQTGQ
jgi:type VI secretion system ImpA family protein